jgi:virginiamycin B lyase
VGGLRSRRPARARGDRWGRGLAGVAVIVATVIIATTSPVDTAHAAAPDALRTITVGGVPDRVVVGAGAVWVGDGGRVTHLDPTTSRRERVPGAATPIAVGAGAFWARAHLQANTILRIDPATNRTVASIDIGVDPGAIAVDGTDVWVADPAGTLVRVDARSNTVQNRIWIGSLTFGIVAEPDGVWVTGRTYDDRQAVLWRVDPATNTVVATTPTPVNCGALAADGATIWVECITANRIDPSTNALVSTRAGALQGLAVADGAAWALSLDRALTRIGPGDQTLHTITVPAGSEGLAVGFGAVWIANPDVAGVVTRAGRGSLTRIPTSRFGAPVSCASCDQSASRATPDAHAVPT